ncbi:M23 family metallopeptidase [Rhizobium helianthi]|uniref:M23 family metallopeptidase n=1 Tax=Rhizobium helianthi TaxID=1132695 RepID=A0ABW4LZV3_9HYPH
MLILASGERVRHMTIRPWMIVTTLSSFALVTLCYLGATAYLVLRDDLIGASMARQARMQNDYEDRISALRAQLDRITSRQLLDQQVVEQKVEQLLQQQDALFSRHGKLGGLMQRAEDSGLSVPGTKASAYHPEDLQQQGSLKGGHKAIEGILGTSGAASIKPAQPSGQESVADQADRVFSKVTLSLKNVEQEQLKRIRSLTANASRTAEAMASIMLRTGVQVPEAGAGGIGGPFVEPVSANSFDTSITALDQALSRLESVRKAAVSLPFANPAPGHEITSGFGNRIDPFLGRLALHAGVDFQADLGTTVKATGSGKVVNAGPSGGYGNMIEIDHGQGITTRYGHLSSILVAVGDTVSAGETIGRAGSTGRSTGPHVHYEVRRNGDAIDPMHFLNAGLKLTTYLK